MLRERGLATATGGLGRQEHTLVVAPRRAVKIIAAANDHPPVAIVVEGAEEECKGATPQMDLGWATIARRANFYALYTLNRPSPSSISATSTIPIWQRP
jgi:hypothetical protein